METTKIQIASRSGANGAPSSGYVTFSDGKCYYFGCDHIAGGFRFGGWRKVAGESERFSFKSSKREKALVAAINA